MKSFVKMLRRAWGSGSSASIASTAALVQCGVRDCCSAIAPVNAVSHWIWEDKALWQHRASLRYSLAGYCIHHAASVFWALAYEKLVRSRGAPPSNTMVVGSAATVAAVACVVDMRCTPERLTPGFERRLSKPSLFMVYTAFGIGLALHTLLRDRE